jgi:hypothetical protein
MLLVGAVDIAIGWAWHTVHQVRHHWRLKREGALAAAALVALVGTVETLRHGGHGALPEAQRTTVAVKVAVPNAEIPAVTAQATPPAAVEQAPTTPAVDPVETVAALPSPEPAADEADPIGAKIMERLGDDVATGSLGDDPEPPAAEAYVAPEPAPAKPHRHKAGAKAD